MTTKLKGQLFDYSMDSLYVKLAVTRLFQQRKMKDLKIDGFVARKNIINEGDLLKTILEIDAESKKAGINLTKQ